MKDKVDEFEAWQKNWDDAQKEGIFGTTPQPTELPEKDFFGNYVVPQDFKEKEVDTQYWNQVYRHSAGLPDDVLNETNSVAEIKSALNAPNPIRVDTIGKDSDYETAVNEKELLDLADLKIKIGELESELNANEVLERKTSDLQTKIDAIKQKIDVISDNLTNIFKKD